MHSNGIKNLNMCICRNIPFIYSVAVIMAVVVFFYRHIYRSICSKSLKGSSRQLTLFTFEYFKNTNARQDQTCTHKTSEKIKIKKQKKCIYIIKKNTHSS